MFIFAYDKRFALFGADITRFVDVNYISEKPKSS